MTGCHAVEQAFASMAWRTTRRFADLSSGYDAQNGDYAHAAPERLTADPTIANNHPPCFWDGDEEEFCWTRPAPTSCCPQVSGEWGDLGAVCVRVGGCFETMGCFWDGTL